LRVLGLTIRLADGNLPNVN